MLTIDDLSDDDLLAIFDFYVFRYQDAYFREPQLNDDERKRKIESWQSLIHVCQRWRALVFGSPRQLNLQLFCIPERSARKYPDVWLPIPLLIRGIVSETFEVSVDNAIAVLKHNDRVCRIDLHCFKTTPKKKIWAAMEVPFPELESLTLSSGASSYVPVLPDSILGGSAPRLRDLSLSFIPFPALPKLLMSATHLVNLHLDNIPHSGYISPDSVATCLSVLTSLETFRLQFQFHPNPKSRRPFPLIRFVLPTLTMFWFKGMIKYLEEFMAQIDAPRLSCFSTKFFDEIYFDTPELNHFIIRTPTLGAYNEAHLVFRGDGARVMLRQSHPEPSDNMMVNMEIFFQLSGSHLPTVAQICTLSLRHLLTMENLYIDGDPFSPLVWDYGVNPSENRFCPPPP